MYNDYNADYNPENCMKIVTFCQIYKKYVYAKIQYFDTDFQFHAH